MNSYHKLLLSDSRFYYEDGLFYQGDLSKNNSFEETYLKLRQREGRLYDDATARLLPHYLGRENLVTEWEIRKRSTQRLARYLKHKHPARIMEIGCGNGWLTRYLHSIVNTEYCCLDINEHELQQAVRISNTSSICFVYGDVLSETTEHLQAEVIIVASAAQYFQDLKAFLHYLFRHLPDQGEIHIIDTPFYHDEELASAQNRTAKYFASEGITDAHYYHHAWSSLESFSYKVAYHPKSVFNKVRRLFTEDSPFPWIIVKKV